MGGGGGGGGGGGEREKSDLLLFAPIISATKNTQLNTKSLIKLSIFGQNSNVNITGQFNS